MGKPPTFRHDTTGFALESAHAQVSCRDCHRTLVFNQVGTACADCHKDAHRGELGASCEACHTPTTWTNQREMFQVHSKTRFPLFASHSRLDCTACHRNQQPYQYKTTPAECGNCHLPTYLRTTNPNHVQSGFSRRCEDCHNVTSPTWRGARFSHPESFPLAGGHSALACARCHTSGNYAGTSSACVSCHQADYAATTNPNHAAGGFPTNCETATTSRLAAGELRSPDDAVPADRRPHARGLREVPRGRPLHGDPDGLLLLPPGELRGHDEPQPPGLGLPDPVPELPQHRRLAARQLRSPGDAVPADRSPQRVDCAQCHVGGRYTGTPTDCYSCHQANYAGTTNPNHQASAFPTQCQTCHSTSAWRPATVDHNKTRFPLTGAHARVIVPSATWAVATRERLRTATPATRRTTRPRRTPTTGAPASRSQCQSCHTTSAWRPATFDHDGRYFPIYSGKHRGKWTNCNECHVSAGNYKVFECILCHAHSNKAKVDADHKGEKSYVYASSACYQCHRNGSAGANGGFRRLP